MINGEDSANSVDEIKKIGGHDITAESPADEEQIVWKAGRHEWLIMGCLTIVTLIVAIDATILVPVLPVIAESLQGNAIDTFWMGTSYLLASAVVQPFVARLSDVFGRRPLLLTSLFFFTTGTVMCSVSKNFTLMLSGRSIQGMGGGGCFSMIHVIITDIIPLRQRPQFLSLTSISWAIATITGPLIGGTFAQDSTWRWCFYLNFPFCFITIVMAVLVIRLDTVRTDLSFIGKIRSVDWIGGGLFIGSTCSFLMGLTWAGSEHPWSSYKSLLPISIGIATFIATILWESKGATDPFLRLSLYKTATANAAFFCAFLQGLIMFCLLYYLPFYFETCKARSPRSAGVSLLPITGILVPTSVITSFLLTRLGRYRWAIWFGFGLSTLANGLLILLNKDTPLAHWAPIFVCVGISQGAILMALVICIQATAAIEDVAYAAAAYSYFRSFGMCVGVAIGGTVFQNSMTHHLRELGLPIEVAQNAEAFVATLNSLPVGSTLSNRYILAYARSFSNVFETLTAITALGLISSFMIKGHSMDKRLTSEHVIRKKKKEKEIA